MLIPAQIPTVKIQLPLLEEKGIDLFVKRLDLVHPLVSGNKFFKLKHNLIAAQKEGHKQILTFGGAFSNHIYATAAAGKQLGIKTIGIIRGEKTLPLNPTLTFANANGMHLHYMDRSTYRRKGAPDVLAGLREKYGHFYLVPEGGTNSLAIKGAGEILGPADQEYDQIATSIGTGGTFAGLLSSVTSNQTVLGFSSLKGQFIHREMGVLLDQYQIQCKKYHILDQYHFGGYGKHTPELTDFIKEFYKQTSIPLDVIYTGKMMYGLLDLIKKGYFPNPARILAIHTGGLQGNLGFNFMHGTQLPLR